MFIESILVAILFGAIVGVLIYETVVTDPLRSEADALRLRLAERRWADEQEARNLERFRKHLGTPYLPRNLPPELSEAIQSVVDDHNGSRKALEVVQ